MTEGRVILIDKPYRWTSFDVVKKIRKALIDQLGKRGSGPDSKRLKVGHAGTLDPLATGLLVICTGPLTKKISLIQDAEKEYTGTIVIGAVTASQDLETEPGNFKDISAIDETMIRSAAEKFRGVQMQVPPAHSAVKIEGKRSYEMARKGIEVEVKSREIEIRELEITAIRLPEIDFRISCSKGTYIRSFARDLGEALGTGAYLKSLCRTRIGKYEIKDAVDPLVFIEQMSVNQVHTV